MTLAIQSRDKVLLMHVNEPYIIEKITLCVEIGTISAHQTDPIINSTLMCLHGARVSPDASTVYECIAKQTLCFSRQGSQSAPIRGLGYGRICHVTLLQKGVIEAPKAHRIQLSGIFQS